MRKALHVDPSLNGRNWSECNSAITQAYNEIYESVDTVFNDIIEKYKFYNIILYNGDADIACDFMSTQRFLVHHMKYKLKEESSPWFTEGRYAGVATSFENGLRYYTVHGMFSRSMFIFMMIVTIILFIRSWSYGSYAKTKRKFSYIEGTNVN